MKCKKHGRYKGLRKPKNNCPDCLKLYNEVTKASSKYYSITTPNWYCNLIHVITECMTVMLYGKQPAFFWRKRTFANPKAKKFFKNTYAGLKAHEKRFPERISALRLLFGAFVNAEKRRIESQKIIDRDDFAKTIEDNQKILNTKPDIDLINSFLKNTEDDVVISRWELLRKLEKDNGAKEEEGKNDNS